MKLTVKKFELKRDAKRAAENGPAVGDYRVGELNVFPVSGDHRRGDNYDETLWAAVRV